MKNLLKKLLTYLLLRLEPEVFHHHYRRGKKDGYAKARRDSKPRIQKAVDQALERQRKGHKRRMKQERKKVSAKTKKMVKANAGYTCFYCKKVSGDLTVDHLVPVSRGGGSGIGNLVAACQPCNLDKADTPIKDYI